MIYFDNSATTKPYDDVLEAFLTMSKKYFANPSSLHDFGGKVETIINHARKQISQLLHVKESEIYFTSGGTESNNLAIKGAAFSYKKRGNHIITTKIEHSSVMEAFEQLRQAGFKVTYLPVNKDGQINIEDLHAAITDDTILVSIMHVNNEVGFIQPIERIGKMLSEYSKILFHVDGVQACGKIPLDLKAAHVDLWTASAHKFHGLKGSGLLYIRDGVQLSPLLSGGGQESNVRSGTENTAGIVAMAKALRLTEKMRQQKMENMIEIRNYLIRQLKLIPNIITHTPSENAAPHIVHFSACGHRGEVIVHALEKENIYVSTTSACSSKEQVASRTLKAIGVNDEMSKGAIRVSLSYENTMTEAKHFIDTLRHVLKNLHAVRRKGK